ncbi:LysR family transcriptional regulator [Pseudooceanicola nanhaiensis]|uniref:LysR family transcriptional regulator n=1 Tax=Pseudooceanicola nanhaiensis TaxID=375761 RepID=UPI001CD65A03|nr:LysR family transcriptional regulator [Pseudooceanicola nanhaiensis]MCA0922320.1 LysR family transcriptional regulator [Pseudooceanicola nanhaiensis]
MAEERKVSRHLDWNLLRSFVTIAQSSSITAAADRLNLTQPTVSVSLRRLEEQVGRRLIDRSPQSFDLTEAGRALLAEALEILGAVERLQVRLDAAEGVIRGEARIALASHVVSDLFDEAIALFSARHPEASLFLDVVSSRVAIEQVAARQAALAVGLVSDRDPMLDCIPFYRQHYALYCGPRHRLFGRTGLTLADLHDEVSVGLLTDRTDKAFLEVAGLRFRAGLRPEVAGRSRNLEEIRRMIIAGVGIGPMPVHIAARDCADGMLWRLPPYDQTATTEVFLISAADRALSPLEKAVKAAFLDVLADVPPEDRVYGG